MSEISDPSHPSQVNLPMGPLAFGFTGFTSLLSSICRLQMPLSHPWPSHVETADWVEWVSAPGLRSQLLQKYKGALQDILQTGTRLARHVGYVLNGAVAWSFWRGTCRTAQVPVLSLLQHALTQTQLIMTMHWPRISVINTTVLTVWQPQAEPQLENKSTGAPNLKPTLLRRRTDMFADIHSFLNHISQQKAKIPSCRISNPHAKQSFSDSAATDSVHDNLFVYASSAQ